jgi:hypothetical protein
MKTKNENIRYRCVLKSVTNKLIKLTRNTPSLAVVGVCCFETLDLLTESHVSTLSLLVEAKAELVVRLGRDSSEARANLISFLIQN